VRRHDLGWGLLVAVVTLLCVALPVGWAGSLAHASFSGCWITCGGSPKPAIGAVWSLVAALLLATPVALGLIVARVRSWAAWLTNAVLVLVVVGAWVLFSLDPDTAEFFVSLG
jgi:hypothetical protein